jgi:hypothetical protein
LTANSQWSYLYSDAQATREAGKAEVHLWNYHDAPEAAPETAVAAAERFAGWL